MTELTHDIMADHEQVELAHFEKSNFRYSFSFLPKEEREAMNSLYAFCSYIDDIVDTVPSKEQLVIKRKLERLAWWEKEIDNLYDKTAKSKIAEPFSKLIDRFLLPKQYFLTLIDGCRRDLVQNSYQSFEELQEYCYSVASIVGLMSIEVFGYKYEDTKLYAKNLGYALQLTNILRDIKGDKDRGYIYLPQEDLDRFGYTQEDLYNEVYNENFVKLMKFEVKRAREYYHKARTYLRVDERISLFPAQIMDAIYYRLLDKIELNNYDIFSKKIKVSNSHKLMIAVKYWLSTKMFIKTYTH